MSEDNSSWQKTIPVDKNQKTIPVDKRQKTIPVDTRQTTKDDSGWGKNDFLRPQQLPIEF